MKDNQLETKNKCEEENTLMKKSKMDGTEIQK